MQLKKYWGKKKKQKKTCTRDQQNKTEELKGTHLSQKDTFESLKGNV